MPRLSTQSPYRQLALAIIMMFGLVLYVQSTWANWQSFMLNNGHIVIDVEIAGKTVKAILDSGASINMIRSDFVEEYGQNFKKSGKVEMTGVYGKKKLQMYSGIPMKLFGSDVTLNDTASGPSYGPELLLGGGFFRNFIVQIDYPNSRLRRLGKENVDMKEHSNVPMKRVRGSRFPAIQVETNGVKTWLILDTGNSGGIFVKRSFATESGWLNAQTDTKQLMGFGLFESNTILNFRLDALTIGPYKLDNVSVNVPIQDNARDFGKYFNGSSGSRIKKGVKAKGLIGYDVLKHFIITIDYMNYRVNLYVPP